MRQLNTTRTLSASGKRIDWIRPAIILGILLASAVLAYMMPSRPMLLLLIGLGPAVTAMIVYLKQPALGMLALVFAAMAVPLSIGTGTDTSLNPVVLLVPALTMLWVLDMALRKKAIRVYRHTSVYLVLALMAAVGLSYVVGQLSWFDISGAGAAAQLGGLLVFVISGAAFLLAAHTLEERWLSRVTYLFIGLGSILVVARIIPPLGSIVNRFVVGGAYGSVFWIWLVALPAGLALFHDRLSANKRAALAFIALMTLFVGFFRSGEWASGWAPPLVALLILIWLRFPRWGWTALFIATLVFITEFDRFWLLATSNESWLARRQAWQIVLDTVAVNPLLGLGPSNYYFYVQQATIMGWGGAWSVKFSSHNNWVDLIAQTGLIGTLLFIAFSISIARVGWRIYTHYPDGFARGYATACIAGLIGTLISGLLGDWFLPFVYNVGLEGMRASIMLWIFLGGLLSLYMADNSPAEPKNGSLDHHS